MSSTLYWDCAAGISGDMAVASLLDLGADSEFLLSTLKTLPLESYSIKITQVEKSGIKATDFAVVIEGGLHDHDMAYLYDFSDKSLEKFTEYESVGAANATEFHKQTSNIHASHRPISQKEAVKDSAKNHHCATHSHRNLRDIESIIAAATLTDGARRLALKIFEIIARAEAQVHGKSVEEVHFHEVGALDSIIDIVSLAVCIDNLGIEDVIVPQLYDGQGTVRCQHGLIPVPAPAVMAIMAQYQIPLQLLPTGAELVTPTGAAIVAALRRPMSARKPFYVKAIGYGAGKRDYPSTSGLLRALLITPQAEAELITPQAEAETIHNLPGDSTSERP